MKETPKMSHFRKGLAIALVFLCSAWLLTSCGASPEEEALKANCKIIFSKLKAIEDTPEIFENSTYAEGKSVALLLGAQTQKDVEEKILTLFPFLDEMIVGRPRDKQYVDLYYYAGSVYLIKEALVGTDIKFPYTPEEVKKIASQPDGWKTTVNPLAIKIFGDFYETKNHQGCAVVDNAIENPDTEKNTSVAFSRATDVYLKYASFLQAIRDCRVSGWHEGNKCLKSDYVSKPDNYKPSNELTQEEKDILAQREKDAQNGNQGSSGSSGNSNVSAGQACTSLGAVVKTTNYGELTCKFVIFGGLRALLWMRS